MTESTGGQGQDPSARPEAAPGSSGRPGTGDREVDRVLAELDERLCAQPEGHVEDIAEAHRQLQARLAGAAVPPPGQGRPGPR